MWLRRPVARQRAAHDLWRHAVFKGIFLPLLALNSGDLPCFWKNTMGGKSHPQRVGLLSGLAALSCFMGLYGFVWVCMGLQSKRTPASQFPRQPCCCNDCGCLWKAYGGHVFWMGLSFYWTLYNGFRNARELAAPRQTQAELTIRRGFGEILGIAVD